VATSAASHPATSRRDLRAIVLAVISAGLLVTIGVWFARHYIVLPHATLGPPIDAVTGAVQPPQSVPMPLAEPDIDPPTNGCRRPFSQADMVWRQGDRRDQFHGRGGWIESSLPNRLSGALEWLVMETDSFSNGVYAVRTPDGGCTVRDLTVEWRTDDASGVPYYRLTARTLAGEQVLWAAIYRTGIPELPTHATPSRSGTLVV
jgi:hypothetical protein